MFANKKEIEDIVIGICEKNHCSKKMFEVSTISNATGGASGYLYNRTKVLNQDCTYVIKYYKQLDIIVIWNYAKNHNMSYSLKNVKQKLADGIKYGDKGIERHNNNQSRVYFDRGDGLRQLLEQIMNPM